MNIAIIRSIGGMVFDATFEEQHESSLSITDNPVETGVVASDHAFMDPLKVTIRAGVSDTPIHTQGTDIFASANSRSQTAFAMLQQLQARAEPFNVQTGLRLYTNMLILKIRALQDKDTDRILAFEADLREVIIFSTQLVTIPPRQPGRTARQGSARKQKGEQQGTQVTSPAVKQSLLNMLFPNILGGPAKP